MRLHARRGRGRIAELAAVMGAARNASCFSSPLAFVMASPEECALAWNGITFYGRIDVGVTHDTHGVPFNGAYPNGVETQISKNSNRSLTSIAPNGLGESFLGLKGVEPIGASDWSLIFNAQTGFDPYSLSMLRPVRPTQKRTTPGSPRRAPRRRRRRGSSGRRRRTAYGGHIPARFRGRSHRRPSACSLRRATAVSQGAAHRQDTHAVWRSKPSFYAVSTEDRTIDPNLERFMAKRMGATTIEVRASQVSLISHPQEIAELILKAAGGARALPRSRSARRLSRG
jgi:hypothetical protein